MPPPSVVVTTSGALRNPGAVGVKVTGIEQMVVEEFTVVPSTVHPLTVPSAYSVNPVCMAIDLRARLLFNCKVTVCVVPCPTAVAGNVALPMVKLDLPAEMKLEPTRPTFCEA